MIPIGDSIMQNTVDVTEAVCATASMRPSLVIPCHYDCPAFFTKHCKPADDKLFKSQVEKIGARCVILNCGDSMDLDRDRDD